MEINSNNKLEIIGEIISEPTFSHKSHGEEFMGFQIKSPRLSESHDTLEVIAEKNIIEEFEKGDIIHIDGEFRSFNNYSGKGNRLVLTIFAHDIDYASKEESMSSINNLELNAFLCKKPIFRKTPFGREITDLLLAVNRRFNKSDYIPAICWGRNARSAAKLVVGDNVKTQGRVQSRNYKKKIDEDTYEDRVAYEYSISNIEIMEKEE